MSSKKTSVAYEKNQQNYMLNNMLHKSNKDNKKSSLDRKLENKKSISKNSYKKESLSKLHDRKIKEILGGSIEKIKEIEQIIKKDELKLKKYKIEEEKDNYKIKIKDIMSGTIVNDDSKHIYQQYIIETRNIIQKNKQQIELLKSQSYKDNQITEYLLNTSMIVHEYSSLSNDESNYQLKEELYSEFEKITIDKFKHVDNNKQVNLKIYYTCPNCNTELTELTEDALCCNICGHCQKICNIPDKLSYDELQEMGGIRKVFTYDKLSHFEENLKRLCSKENAYIPDEVITKIKERIEMDNITDFNTLTEKHIRCYLKKLEMKKYYENVISILNRINGRKSLKLTTEIEEKLKEMFQKIRLLYDKYKPKDRKNFFSYPFLISKFLQILELKEFNKYILQLKSQEKLREQDIIFEKIVNELSSTDKTINWKFFPSI
jgi:hypothetical protein